MWKSVAMFLAGALAALVAFLKFKKPEVTNVAGDLIEEQKIKDKSKHKLSRKQIRLDRKKARILKRKQKRLS